MLKWTIVFFILAIIAGVFGFGGLATGFAFAAKILFFGFIALMILSLVGQGLRALAAFLARSGNLSDPQRFSWRTRKPLWNDALRHICSLTWAERVG